MPTSRPLLLATALLLAAAPLAAQSDDTTAVPFRAGQWATQFGFDGNLASAGAVRFRSAQTAWVVDAAGVVSSTTVDLQPEDRQRDINELAGRLQLGIRRYRGVAPRANAFTGIGLLGTGFVNRQPLLYGPDAGVATVRESNAGIYGELGATWMVTRNLGLGAATTLDATHLWRHQESPGSIAAPGSKIDETGWQLRLGRARLIVTVFF